MDSKVELSVIIPVTESYRYDDVIQLFQDYKDGIEEFNMPYEMIYVLDGEYPDVEKKLLMIRKNEKCLKIIKLAKWFGEATAITAAFEHCQSDLILTLPAYAQIEPHQIKQLLKNMGNADMVITRRWPRQDSWLNRVQSSIFNFLVKFITGIHFHDLGSSTRLFKRQVLEEIPLYGDQHRFLPLLAYRFGFKIKEIPVAQSSKDAFQRIHPIGTYLRRLLDLFSIFFLIKFSKKPLRFFGLLGTFMFSAGSLLAIYLFIQRIFLKIALADRPIVLVSLLLIVLGIQIVAIGLIGEIIIFTHAKELKEYTIEKIIN
jgi:glycosyltransferase involved in cell wall biosynthesis